MNKRAQSYSPNRGSPLQHFGSREWFVPDGAGRTRGGVFDSQAPTASRLVVTAGR